MNEVNRGIDDYQRGASSPLSPCWRDLIAADPRPMPKPYQVESSPNLGSAKIPPERYISHEFHRREIDKIWKRTWQMVCREEEIPGIGDHFVYNVADLSFIVVRVAEKTFKAYWNVCLHRGRRLVDHDGCNAKQFKCGYHSWTWKIDGTLAFYPGKWDFPDVDPLKYSLREVQVGNWNGFIFINPDSNGITLEKHLGSLPKHFETWPLDRRYTLWHVQKTINSNWKVAMEAFLEAYHVVQTHPQALPSVAENATQYDVYDEGPAHFSRSITPSAVPSIHAKNATTISAIADMWSLLNALRSDQATNLPPNIKDRASLAEWRRGVLSTMTKADYSRLADAEMLDSIQYWLFPNFCPWYGEGLPLTYLFRPNGDSPDSCYFDIWMLIRSPDAEAPPPAAKLVKLGPGDRFEPVLGAMGKIFDQDDENMPFVQIGLKTWPGKPEGVTLGRYQEIRIRHFHQVLMNVLEQP